MAPARARSSAAGGAIGDRAQARVRAPVETSGGAARRRRRVAPERGPGSARPAVCVVRDLSGASSSYVNKSESRLYALEAAHEQLCWSRLLRSPFGRGARGYHQRQGALIPGDADKQPSRCGCEPCRDR